MKFPYRCRWPSWYTWLRKIYNSIILSFWKKLWGYFEIEFKWNWWHRDNINHVDPFFSFLEGIRSNYKNIIDFIQSEVNDTLFFIKNKTNKQSEISLTTKRANSLQNKLSFTQTLEDIKWNFDELSFFLSVCIFSSWNVCKAS